MKTESSYCDASIADRATTVMMPPSPMNPFPISEVLYEVVEAEMADPETTPPADQTLDESQ
jgi:hypothetical protein